MGYYTQLRICQAESSTCEGQREPDKNLSGSQHAPGQGQEADNVCLGSSPREGRLAGIQKYVCTGVEKQEGGEQAGGTMEQLKSKRRKHQWYPFRQRTCTSIQNKVKPERKSKTTTSFHLSSPLYFKCPLAIWARLQLTDAIHISSSLVTTFHPFGIIMPQAYLALLIFIFLHSNSLSLEKGEWCFPSQTWHQFTVFHLCLFQNNLFCSRRLSLQWGAHVQNKCSILNHESPNLQFIQIFTKRYF